ncbi:PARP7S [Mytilus edulis]|uniref:PARP7S n=1 Tax=Mytilus edulis TaxID=6550 RepID=A0A8S3VN78_MYTED|nr:PARP7S [Mytilus edulis]
MTKKKAHTKINVEKVKNVFNAIAKKPSGTNTYNIEGVSANEILDFVITTFENGCTFEDFVLQCNLFPSSADIPRWFEKHLTQFHIFKKNEKIEYILPYVKTADICFGYNNPRFPGKCSYSVKCHFFHVCRRFVRNIYCNFKGCKLAHDFTNAHNSRLLTQFRLENFSEKQIKTVLNNHFPSICRDYSFNEKCKVGTKKCVNLHLCGSYKFGKCEEPCKYKRTHKLSKDHNKWVLRAFEMRDWPADKILKNIYVPPKRVPSYPRNAKGDSDHYKCIDDDDDDLYKGSDFIDLDENNFAPRADISDSNSDEDESDKLSI